MACVNEKGQLTESAKKLLLSIESKALPVADISKETGIPLFKVRSSLRDMLSMGFVLEEGEKYKLNPKASKLLNK